MSPHATGGFLKLWSEGETVLAQATHIDARMLEFQRMTDIPTLKALAGHLGMELERQPEVANRKCLVRSVRGSGKHLGPDGQIECVPVPVQDPDLRREQRPNGRQASVAPTGWIGAHPSSGPVGAA